MKLTSTDPKIVVVGPGGVGGYYGALLARAGLDVCFIGRGDHVKAIRERGVYVESHKGDFRAKPRATDNPDEIDGADIILFCVKSFDTARAAGMIRQIVAPRTIILSMQNGVENEEVIGHILGREKVIGGVAYIGSRIKSPGIILHTAAGTTLRFKRRGSEVNVETDIIGKYVEKFILRDDDDGKFMNLLKEKGFADD